MRTLPTSALAGLVLATLTGRAAATDYFVAPTGDDAAAGTMAAPWKTLQKAAGTVVAGDTVTARDGTYAGFQCDGRSGTAGARIVFRSETKGGAKITSAGVGADAMDWVQLNSCSYVTVDGFEVSGAPRSGIAILGNTTDGSDARDVIIQNNHSHHNGGPVAHGRHDGIFSGFALNLTVQDNETHDNSEHGIYVSNAADNPIIRRNHVHDVGVNCVQINADLSTGGDGLISNWLIDSNVVHGCGSAGFNLDGAIQGVLQNNLAYDCAKGGVTLFQGDGAQASHDNLVVNNTIFNPTGSRAALQVAVGANNNVVFNNILYAQAIGLEIQAVTGLVHDDNFVSSYSGGAASAHEAAPDPATLFADVAGRGLALSANSPARDSGVATLGGKMAPAVDIEGKPRPAGAGYDRGCYEGGSTGGGPAADGGARDGAMGGSSPRVDAGRDTEATGTAGATGAAGTTGAAGASGAAGAISSAGAAGAAGTSASAGTAGAAGTTSAGAAGSSPAGAAGGPEHATTGGGGCGCALSTSERSFGGGAPASLAFWIAVALLLGARRRARR
jgi:parallel beta-helix repeat protein